MQLSGRNEHFRKSELRDFEYRWFKFGSKSKRNGYQFMKIAFVIPWYGENIPGGAETECRTTAENLQKSGIEVEILTTCAKEFLSDWNIDHYKEGVYQVNHITVRRFSVRKRDSALFDSINYKLMHNQKISLKEEEIFIHEMVNSDNLEMYIQEHGQDYDFFLFIPYMFGTTYYGSQIRPEKSILIPCLHDESLCESFHL